MSQAQLLKAARKEFDWTQQQAADAVGVGVRTWQMWEAEEGTTSFREAPEMLFRLLELNRILNGAGLPVSWDEINEQAAARSHAMILRPPRATYNGKEV
jgi:DNA-binding XRE family transcriptional regulator